MGENIVLCPLYPHSRNRRSDARCPAADDGWEQVTFGDALNMATSIGDGWPRREPNHPFVDYDTKKAQFVGARTAQQKLAIAFSA